MARTDLLGKALSMTASVREGRISRGRAFGDAVLRTMSSAGDFHVSLAIPAYPRDAQRRDLECIGKDMYRAVGSYVETQASPQG